MLCDPSIGTDRNRVIASLSHSRIPGLLYTSPYTPWLGLWSQHVAVVWLSWVGWLGTWSLGHVHNHMQVVAWSDRSHFCRARYCMMGWTGCARLESGTSSPSV